MFGTYKTFLRDRFLFESKVEIKELAICEIGRTSPFPTVTFSDPL